MKPSGRRRRAAPQHRPPLRLKALDTVWSLEIQGDAGSVRRKLLKAWPDHTGTSRERRGRLCLRIGTPRPAIAPGNRVTRDGIFLAAERIAARISLDGLTAEVWAAAARDVSSALGVFFRAAAMRKAADGRWLCLHAASALSRTTGRLYVFAGPSGIGKTTCAQAFGRRQIADDDFVLLRSGRKGFERVAYLPEGQTRRPPRPDLPGNYPVSAIIFPGRAAGFSLNRVPGAEAFRRCLHLPPTLPNQGAVALVDAVHRLVEAVPVFQLRWQKGQDLPRLLEETLRKKP